MRTPGSPGTARIRSLLASYAHATHGTPGRHCSALSGASDPPLARAWAGRAPEVGEDAAVAVFVCGLCACACVRACVWVGGWVVGWVWVGVGVGVYLRLAKTLQSPRSVVARHRWKSTCTPHAESRGVTRSHAESRGVTLDHWTSHSHHLPPTVASLTPAPAGRRPVMYNRLCPRPRSLRLCPRSLRLSAAGYAACVVYPPPGHTCGRGHNGVCRLCALAWVDRQGPRGVSHNGVCALCLPTTRRAHEASPSPPLHAPVTRPPSLPPPPPLPASLPPKLNPSTTAPPPPSSAQTVVVTKRCEKVELSGLGTGGRRQKASDPFESRTLLWCV
jgi:hypothetical protein